MSIITTTIKGWFGHRVQQLAAAFTFYALLSLGPLLVIALTIASHVLDSVTARSQSIHHLAYFVGPEGASIINKIIDGAANAQHKIMTTSIGAILLYLAGSAVFNSLHEAMNCIWEVPSGKRNTILTFIRKQIITVLLVILIVSLFLMSLISSLVLASVGTFISSVVTIPVFLMNLTDFILSVIVFTGLFMFIFKIVPDVKISWKDVRTGALFTSLLFNISKFFISRILGHSEIMIAYGSLASFILITLWVYISAQIVFLGAEYTRAHILYNQGAKRKVKKRERNVIVRL
ncbi:MAG: YihY/virulence factor BrkB family protein [Fibrobacterota bacterium]